VVGERGVDQRVRDRHFPLGLVGYLRQVLRLDGPTHELNTVLIEKPSNLFGVGKLHDA
jgi:hypothetical protein